MKDSSLVDSLASISENQLRNYLLSSNWVEDGNISNIASIWHRSEPDKSEYEILQPTLKTIRDFKERIRDLFYVLSDFERRSIADIYRDISNYHSDLISIRIAHEDVNSGSIPLTDGVLLIEKASELLTSASLSTLSKKKFFSGSKPHDVINFMDNVKLGQTEIGSYIINIIAPLDAQEVEQYKLLELSSFSRMVITNLSKSLEAITSSIEIYKDNSDLNIFDETVQKGVSANLCDALIGMSGEKQNRDVNVAISFSKLDSKDEDVKINHTFSSEIIPYLEKASEYLKESYVILNITISGFVKKLDRENEKEFGLVTIVALVEEKNKNVTFELSGNDYLNAIHAHENKQIVKCTGDLHINPRSAKLLNNKDFSVQNNGDLFK